MGPYKLVKWTPTLSLNIAEEIKFLGLSGKFSSAKNVYEFRDNLFNGVNMTDAPMRGWEYIKSEVYNKLGSIEEIQKFDAGFFGMSHNFKF